MPDRRAALNPDASLLTGNCLRTYPECSGRARDTSGHIRNDRSWPFPTAQLPWELRRVRIRPTEPCPTQVSPCPAPRFVERDCGLLKMQREDRSTLAGRRSPGSSARSQEKSGGLRLQAGVGCLVERWACPVGGVGAHAGPTKPPPNIVACGRGSRAAGFDQRTLLSAHAPLAPRQPTSGQNHVRGITFCKPQWRS